MMVTLLTLKRIALSFDTFISLKLLVLLWIQLTLTLGHSSWDQWWAYDGISGPDYWGILNPKWSHCSKGRKQSPIDINPDSLLFDPGLEPIQIKGDLIHGDLMNTGRGLKLGVHGNGSSVTITSGPLSYQYSINHMIFHYGRETDRGSEHTINGVSFAGELQLYFYNSQLYHNWTQAAQESNGLAVIAVLIHVASTPEEEESSTSSLNLIVKSIEHIKFKGATHKLDSMSISKLLPTLEHYITYEGSLTEPPCHETVQWIVLNKPLYATNHQLSLIRNSLNIDGYGDNYRPIQLTNYRCVRTNILREFNATLDEVTQSMKENHHEFNKKRICGNKGYVTYKANIKRDLDGT